MNHLAVYILIATQRCKEKYAFILHRLVRDLFIYFLENKFVFMNQRKKDSCNPKGKKKNSLS